MKRSRLVLFFVIPLFAFSQNACDSVFLSSFKLDPLNTDQLILQVENYSTTLFDYPGWRIKDANNNLVGEEVVNFFGIGQQSTHIIPHMMGQLNSGETANLIMELWTGFFSNLACTFEFNEVLYDVQDCGEIQISIWFSSTEAQQISVSIRDSDFNQIYFDIIDNDSLPYIFIDLCLFEDCYSLLIEPAASFIFDQDVLFQLMTSDAWASPPAITLQLDSATGSQSVDFPIYYGDCSTGIDEQNPSSIRMIVNNGFLSFIENRNTKGPFFLKLFDTNGAILFNEKIRLDEMIRLTRCPIIIAELSTATYVITQKIINP